MKYHDQHQLPHPFYLAKFKTLACFFKFETVDFGVPYRPTTVVETPYLFISIIFTVRNSLIQIRTSQLSYIAYESLFVTDVNNVIALNYSLPKSTAKPSPTSSPKFTTERATRSSQQAMDPSTPPATSSSHKFAAKETDLEAFPSLTGSPSSPRRASDTTDPTRSRGQSNSSSLQARLRSASKKFEESNPPTGMWIATGQIASNIPSISDVRRGSFTADGWSGEGQAIEKQRRQSLGRRGSSQGSEDLATARRGSTANSPKTTQGPSFRHQSVPETVEEGEGLGVIPSGIPTTKGVTQAQEKDIEMGRIGPKRSDRSSTDTNVSPETVIASKSDARYRTEPFDNGYQFPPKHSWGDATGIFLKAFWKFFITPIGFLVTIYGLNVVAWGGMLFLLLCNASPAMCKPDCNNINSPRRIWIEIDSQILNALFCVTGFGTIPWRFRDLYYLLQYRIQKKEVGLRRLAGINRGWFRLAGSQDLPISIGPADIETEVAGVPESSIPFPISKISNAPLTGIRAPPTKMWKLDFVIWAMVWNTFLQACLSGFMWGLNRYNRPSWSTGLFVALACIVAACGGIMAFVEGKHVKSIEGVPVSEKDQERLRRDRELGITHWNNIKDEKPKEPKEKKENKLDGALFHRKQKDGEEVQVEESAIQDGVGRVVR